MTTPAFSPTPDPRSREIFIELFTGLSRAHGCYDTTKQPKIDPVTQKKTGQAWTVETPPTAQDYHSHLDGGLGLGIVPIRDDGTVLFGGIDVDNKDLRKSDDEVLTKEIIDERVNEIITEAIDREFPLVPTRSKSGGLMLWAFVLRPIPAMELWRRLDWYRRELGRPGKTELFPKQKDKPGQVGSWVNLPYHGATRWMELDGERSDLRTFVEYALERRAELSALIDCDDNVYDSGYNPEDESDDRDQPEAILTLTLEELAAGKWDSSRDKAGWAFFKRLCDALVPIDQALSTWAPRWREEAMKATNNFSDFSIAQVKKCMKSGYKDIPRPRFKKIAGLPHGYEVRLTPFEHFGGVYRMKVDQQTEKKKRFRICSPMYTAGHGQEIETGDWYRLFHIKTRDDVDETIAVPEVEVGSGIGWMSNLTARSFVSLADEDVIKFVKLTNSPARCAIATRTGWHKGDRFVLPDNKYSPIPNEAIQYTGTADRLGVKGTADGWRREVGDLCRGNDVLVFAVNCAFVPVIDERAQVFGGFNPGVHFHEKTSRGKTTSLIVAGSVVGGPKYYHEWAGTAVGFEMLAAQHNSLPLCLDDIGKGPLNQLSKIVYMLSGGEGKARGTRSIQLAETPKWHTFLLSTGELTLQDALLQIGETPRGGQDVRLINIRCNYEFGSFQDVHGAEAEPGKDPIDSKGAAFARRISEGVQNNYGAPLRAFLQDFYFRREKLIPQFKERAMELAKKWGAAGGGEVPRVAQTFALVAAAGEMAAQLGVTGFTAAECVESAHALFLRWLDNRDCAGSIDDKRYLDAVRKAVSEGMASRFEDLDDTHKEVIINGVVTVVPKERPRLNPHWGYLKRNTEGLTEIWVKPDSLEKEIAKGFSPKSVLQELLAQNVLLVPPSKAKEGKFKSLRETTYEGRLPFYVLSRAALLGEDNTPIPKISADELVQMAFPTQEAA